MREADKGVGEGKADIQEKAGYLEYKCKNCGHVFYHPERMGIEHCPRCGANLWR